MRILALLAVIVGVVSGALPWDSVRKTRNSICNCGWTNKGRIVGGKETVKNEYPFVAVLENTKGQFCGGTILTEFHVVTAAHCTFGQRASNINVRVGAHDLRRGDGTVHRVARIIQHENYDSIFTVNDISLLLVQTPIRYNQNVGPACLPARQSNLAGQSLKALGWGSIYYMGPSSSVLQAVDLKVISYEECIRRWPNAGRSYPRRGTNLCTYVDQKDTCQGDSGGPLVWLNPSTRRYSIVALVSYGGVCAGSKPAINTDVGGFLDWINRNIAATKPGAAACTKG